VIAPPILLQDLPPGVEHVATSFFLMVGIIALGIPLIRMIGKRFERGAQLPPPPSPEITTRLERIEQAVEAIAIEVERIAEAQRFAAKLMAEQQQVLKKLPRADAPTP
jgi:hypothetical protein